MAGILDSKTRIMDVIITDQGKRQMSSGKMRIEYASISDSMAFYEYDAVSGSSDASSRIYFEANSLPQDFITFESDDSGILFDFDIGPNEKIINNKIYRRTISGSVNSTMLLQSTGSKFASTAQGFITGSIDNFGKLYMIGSRTGVLQDLTDFIVKPESLSYTITNSVPFASGTNDYVVDIDAIEPVYLDKRLGHLPNFKFLPPTDKKGTSIGNFINLNEKEIFDFNDLVKELGPLTVEELLHSANPYEYSDGSTLALNTDKPSGKRIPKESHTFSFINTTESNNIMMQMFEISNNSLLKLDAIDFGEFFVENDPKRPNKHVFFIGKVINDSFGSPTFINLFTMVLD